MYGMSVAFLYLAVAAHHTYMALSYRRMSVSVLTVFY